MADKNYKYTKKYDKENTVNISLKLNCKTDADVLEYLDNVDNKQGTIKKLIRDEIERSKDGSVKTYIVTVIDKDQNYHTDYVQALTPQQAVNILYSEARNEYEILDVAVVVNDWE